MSPDLNLLRRIVAERRTPVAQVEPDGWAEVAYMFDAPTASPTVQIPAGGDPNAVIANLVRDNQTLQARLTSTPSVPSESATHIAHATIDTEYVRPNDLRSTLSDLVQRWPSYLTLAPDANGMNWKWLAGLGARIPALAALAVLAATVGLLVLLLKALQHSGRSAIATGIATLAVEYLSHH